MSVSNGSIGICDIFFLPKIYAYISLGPHASRAGQSASTPAWKTFIGLHAFNALICLYTTVYGTVRIVVFLAALISGAIAALLSMKAGYIPDLLAKKTN